MSKSKLTNCKVCGAEVAKNAKMCPSCGAKLKKKHPILLGIIVIVIIIAIVGSLGGNETENKNNDTTANGVETNLEKNENKENDDGNEEVKEDKNEFNVGETAELNGVSVTLKNVTESTGSEYNKPAEGNVFVLCEFEISNNSDKEITVSSMMSFDAYCDDYACTLSLTALIEKGNKNQLDGAVAAGKKFNGVIGYEVPADWKEMEINFTPDFWSGKDMTFIANK